MKQQLNEIQRMQQLAGINLNEIKVVNPADTKYYAIFNFLDNEWDINIEDEPSMNPEPFYYIANTKKEMIDVLNKAYKNTTGEFFSPYNLNYMEESERMYNGEKLPHYINDDFAMVTDDINVFNKDINKNGWILGVSLKKYIPK